MADTDLTANNPRIDIDEDVEDEALGSDVASDTTSLKSYALKYDYEHGRRYQNASEAKYFLPNDEEEQDRMDLEHALWKTMLGDSLFLAPVREPQKIMDLGTGTGIWAMDVADTHPGATVVGTDLSPVQPAFVPPNVEFQIDNFENDWTFQPNSYDLIHSRGLTASVTDYNKLVGQAFTTLKPGGYLEMHDVWPLTYCDDDTMPDDTAIKKWAEFALEAIQKTGRVVLKLEEYKGLLEQAGFVNIKEVYLKRPYNTWAKDPQMKKLGMFQMCNMLAGIFAFSVYLFVNVLGWKQEEVDVFLVKVRQNLRNTRIHAYGRCIAIYGQKPEAS